MNRGEYKEADRRKPGLLIVGMESSLELHQIILYLFVSRFDEIFVFDDVSLFCW